VQEDVRQPLRREPLAVELDDVVHLVEGFQPARLAVHGHASCLDQLVSLAPRGNTGAREVGVQAHARILALPAPRHS
jgi:hypothetical protein